MPTTNDDFFSAVERFVASLGEHVYQEYDDVRRVDGADVVTHVRSGFRRDGSDITHFYTRGEGPFVDVDRWPSERFVDWLLVDGAPYRGRLSLPNPTVADAVAHAMKRLREGHRYTTGGADDPGYGRPRSEWTETLFAEGDSLVIEAVELLGPSDAVRKETRTRRVFTHQAFEQAANEDRSIRGFLGLL
jgi:hypothetical protein